MRNTQIRLRVRAEGKQSPTATPIDHGEWSARRKRSRNGLQGDVGQRSGTIEAHLLEADFWPGTVSGLLIKRKCTARRALPRTANTLTSLDDVLKMNAPATSASHDRPNHLALSHHREAGRRRDGRSIQSRGH